jgi:hypothetical protein
MLYRNAVTADDEGWTGVDFKTAAELGGALSRYRRQITMYASVVAPGDSTSGHRDTHASLADLM